MDSRRIIRDISDGVIVLDDKGTIVEINKSACNLLSLDINYTGKKYGDIIAQNTDSINDEFHQTIIDLIDNTDALYRRSVPYSVDNTIKHFEITTSFTEDENIRYIIITITDRTSEEKHKTDLERAGYIFILGICLLSGWVIIYAIWQFFNIPLTPTDLSYLLIVLSLIPTYFVSRLTPLGVKELGLDTSNIKRVILTNMIFTAVCIIVLIIAKLVILKIDPLFFNYDYTLFNFSKYPFKEYIFYGISVFGQEVLSRGVIYEAVRIVMPGKNADIKAIIISSIMFAALHIHAGLGYMIGAFIFLTVFGFIYRKQKTIWGLLIPHYILGFVIGLMNFTY